MSHAIDLEGLYEKLFLLQHIAHGSLSHCRSAKVVLEDPDFDPEFDPNFKTIWSLTKTLVSNYLIECAVKLRMIQEFCAKHFEADDLNMLEERANRQGRQNSIQILVLTFNRTLSGYVQSLVSDQIKGLQHLNRS